MEGADALGLIAEVGIAIAGFAGVIASLRAPGGRMAPYAAFRIGILFGFSATAVVLALLPFAFDFAGLSSPTIWVLSSSATIILLGTGELWVARVWLAVVPAALEDRAPGERLLGLFTPALLAGICALQIANVVWFRELWPLYVGLLSITAYSLFQFAYVLFLPSRAEVQA